MRGIVVMALLPIVFAAIAHAQGSNVRCVKPGGNNTTDNSGGTTFALAWGSLSYAIEQLNSTSSGNPPTFTEIWVATGSSGYAYTPDQDDPGNPAISIAIHKSVFVRGGFAGTETTASGRVDSNPRTILSGDISGTVNSYRLVVLEMEAYQWPVAFERFEFREANGVVEPIGNMHGGGAFLALRTKPEPHLLASTQHRCGSGLRECIYRKPATPSMLSGSRCGP